MVSDEYQIVNETSSSALAKMVNAAIRDGWEPFGNIQVVNVGRSITLIRFYQPMIRTSTVIEFIRKGTD